MEGFYPVIFWWVTTTQMARAIGDRPIPTLEQCESLLADDVAQRRRIHGNARGYCLLLPEKPADLPEGPPVFVKPSAVDA